VDKRKWLQFCFYALASIIGLFLDLNHPGIKNMLCQPTNSGGLNSENYPAIGDYPTPTRDQPNL